MILTGKHGLLHDWIKSHSTGNIFGSLPFQWNKEVLRFEVRNDKQLSHFLRRFYISIFYLTLVLAQITSTWNKSSNLVKSHTLLFLSVYLFGVICQIVNLRGRVCIVALFNCLIEYDSRIFRERIKNTESNLSSVLKDMDTEQRVIIEKTENFGKPDLITKRLMQLWASTGLVVPILYHLDILRNPCYPMYFGYWLSDQCSTTELGISEEATWKVDEIAAKLGIALVSYVNWSFIFSGLCYYFPVELLLHGHCFRSFIADYGKCMEMEYGYRKFLNAKFRELQLMLKLYRDQYAELMLVMCIITAVTVETFCLYNTIISMRTGGFREFFTTMNLIYIWGDLTCAFAIIFIFGSLADVYKISANVHKRLKSNAQLQSNKLFKRWFRSCPILKIYFGGSNFLEQITPLIIQNYVIELTVNLLLLN